MSERDDQIKRGKTWGKIFDRAPRRGIERMPCTVTPIFEDPDLRWNPSRGAAPSFVTFDETAEFQREKAPRWNDESTILTTELYAAVVNERSTPVISVASLQQAFDALITDVMCRPEMVDEIQAALDREPNGHLYRVVPSKLCPEGKVFMMKRGVLDAAVRGDLG